MGRKPANNATYFMLDWDTHNHRKVKVIRSKYGLEGYAVYVLLLQRLSHSDGVEFPDTPDEIEFLAADFGCEDQLVRNVLDTCYRVGLFVLSESGFFHAERLTAMLQSINNKRKREKDRYDANLESDGRNQDKPPNSGFLPAEIRSEPISDGRNGEIREDKIRVEKRREEGDIIAQELADAMALADQFCENDFVTRVIPFWSRSSQGGFVNMFDRSLFMTLWKQYGTGKLMQALYEFKIGGHVDKKLIGKALDPNDNFNWNYKDRIGRGNPSTGQQARAEFELTDERLSRIAAIHADDSLE